jgi:ParB family transcriptional regulator, chromosome partitioning protein
MNIQPIPLNKLVPSPENVRKTGATAGVAELAAQIKAHGLLQNLTVRPAEGGKFEVIAGRRRLAALKCLARNKDIAKLTEIPCNVIEEGDATEISLVENFGQLPMHPADQFDAFRDLAEKGKGPEEIAARFGCSPLIVRQRLKLASVSPRLVKSYRSGQMTLDQLMAFTVTDDHKAQETAWFRQPEWNRDPTTLRRALTRAHVDASDRRARFVGIETYAAAGGSVLRDLFATDHEGYLTDPALLDRLVVERLEREAQAILGEGWKWITVLPDLDYAAVHGFARVLPPVSRSEDDPEDGQAEYMPVWPAEAMARAGAIIGIDYEGRLRVERGLVRPEDVTDAERGADKRKQPLRRERREADDLPAALTEDLTAQRTAGLRVMLADNAGVALAAVVHALTLPLFYGHRDTKSCLSLKLETSNLRASAKEIDGSAAMRALAQRQEEWRQRLPANDEALWAWCLNADTETLLALMGYCAACSVDAVRRPHYYAEQLTHADQLAAALNLDMRAWWKPTAGTYLGRISRQRIIETVAEGVSPEAADNFRKLPKPTLITHAETRLADSGWLPALLRAPVQAPENEPAAAE